MKINDFILVIVCVSLAECGASSQDNISSADTMEKMAYRLDPSLPRVQQAYLIPDEATCTKHNGKWKRVGRQQRYACVLPTSDAGTECLNNSDCEVGCVAPSSNTEAGRKVVGVCLGSTDVFGCHAYVSNGVVEATLCVD